MVAEDQFEQIIISEYPCLKGYPQLTPKELFGLSPGDKVTRIGTPNKNGNETSNHRFDDFSQPLTYSGTIKLADGEYAAFLFPDEGVSGWDLFNPPQPVYLVYVVLWENEELIRQLHRINNIYIYKAKFNNG